MKWIDAKLETRCGCSKFIEIEYPPKPEIYIAIPMKPHYDPHFSSTSLLNPEVRIFKYYGLLATDPLIASYKEE